MDPFGVKLTWGEMDSRVCTVRPGAHLRLRSTARPSPPGLVPLEGVPRPIVARNHPGADPSPGPQHVKVTKELAEAPRLLGLELLDHVVIGGDEAVGLKDRGLV